MAGLQKKLDEFRRDTGSAILHIQGYRVKIDGLSVGRFPMFKGPDSEPYVKLAPGRHAFVGDFSDFNGMSGFRVRSLDSEFAVEAGREYTLGIYRYKKEELDLHQDDPGLQYIYYQPLSGAHGRFGLVCFIEPPREEEQ